MKISSFQPRTLSSNIEEHLKVGSQVFHNGVPVQLLYRIRQEKSAETWRVRPLFVESPARDEVFRPSDRISLLHTMRAPRWACAT